jgi:hypothetical protein
MHSGELPARTILVTPANAPGSEGLGAVITPENVPTSVTHTGNDAQPITLPTVTTLPGFDSDLIVVPPLETGDKSIYVMHSGLRDVPETTARHELNAFTLPGGKTVSQFEKELAILASGERVAKVKEMADKVTSANEMEKDNKLTKLNNRDVYFRNTDGNLYPLDTQHGRFEIADAKKRQTSWRG